MPIGTAEGSLLVGRYRVIERLGAGGMAAVYLAHDERLDRRVAVKRMHTGGGDEVDARRFGREAKIGAGLSHPNLVSIFDTEQDDESVLLVMEYVEGETLADLLARGPVEPPRAAEIARAVAEGLDHAHANGVVHRDVKPANVLVRGDGAVKLADLGIAKAVERTDITRTGTVLGTPAYMAPEQLEGGRLGPAVDIYSLAAMLYEMLTGRRARRGRTAVEIAHQVVNTPPPDPRDVDPELPAEVAQAIKAGMARDPGDRPASAVELVERMEKALAVPPAPPTAATQRMEPERARPVAAVPARPPTTSPRARHDSSTGAPRDRRVLPVVLGLFALALAAIAIAVSSGGEDDATERAADRGGERQQQGEREEPQGGGAAQDEPEAEEPAPPAEEPADEPAETGGLPEPRGEGGSEQAEQLHLDGHAALEAGDYDRAIELNTRAIEAFPPGTTWQDDMNYAYALYSLGRALRLGGRPEEAIPVLEKRLEVPNQRGTVRRELEQARAAAGDG